MKREIKELYFYNESKDKCKITFVDSNREYFDISIPINRIDLMEIIRSIREGTHPDLIKSESGMKVYHKQPDFNYNLLNAEPETLVDIYLKHIKSNKE